MIRRIAGFRPGMRWLFPGDRYLTGVDVGRSSFKIVQLDRGRRGNRLVYAGLLEFDASQDSWDSGKIAADIRTFLLNKPIKNHPVSTAVMGRSVTIRYFTLPMIPEDELQAAVQWEAKKLLSSPEEELVLDYLTLGEKAEGDLRKRELLLVAASRKVVSEHVEMVRTAGLQVGAVDVNPLVFLNLLRLNYEEFLDQNIAFVDLGAANIEISIAKRGALRFTRNIPAGMDQITRAIEHGAGISYEEAERLNRKYGLELTRSEGFSAKGREFQGSPEALLESIRGILDGFILEIQRSVDFYHVQFRGERIQKMIFTGGGVLMPGLMGYLSGYFDVETVVDNPFSRIHYDPKAFGAVADMAPRFSSAVGLALRPVT